MIRIVRGWDESDEYTSCGDMTMDMNEPTHDRLNDNLSPEMEDEILIGRLVDGEAGDEDDARFEKLAEETPTLWRTLALRQRDMQLLANQVELETKLADQIELPSFAIMPRNITWTLALSGWAAVLILCLTWSLVVVAGGRADADMNIINDQGSLPPLPVTPEEHLRKYKNLNDFVIGELRATLLNTETLADGSVELTYLRRIEEKIIIDAELYEQIELSSEKGETIPHDLLEQLLKQRRAPNSDQSPLPGSSS